MKKQVKELPKEECKCLPKDMSHLGVTLKGEQQYFCRKHNKLHRIATTKEGR